MAKSSYFSSQFLTLFSIELAAAHTTFDISEATSGETILWLQNDPIPQTKQH